VTQSEIIFSVQESPEGGYQARALGFSIFTEADTLDELKTMIRDGVSPPVAANSISSCANVLVFSHLQNYLDKHLPPAVLSHL
jgi:hypothetical protein